MSQHVFEELTQRYGPPAGEEGPVLFVREVLGADPDEWQEAFLRAYGRGERRISIRSCHGPGKTAAASWCVVHSALCRFPQKTVATAPTAAQLYDALFAEVVKWFKRLPPVLLELFVIKSDRIEFVGAPEESFFSARTARAEKPEALQGVHSGDGFVLLIADEGSGVPDAIYEAAAGSMSGHNCTTILLSNPVRTGGFFFDTHHKLRDMWFTVRVAAAAAVPEEEREEGVWYSERVSPDFVEDIARRYGRQSNAFRIRCLGEFPKGDLDAIIPYELIIAAQDRDIEEPPFLKPVWGLDVARFGDDECVLIRRNRLAVDPLIESWQGRDTMQTVGRVKSLWDKAEPGERPEEILIDVIGIGSGVVDRLIELGLPARGINVSENPAVREEYRNLRTELWFKVRDWLAGRDRKLPSRCLCEACERDPANDHAQQLAEDLAAQKLDYTSTGKQMAAPKKAMKTVLGRSPNVGDALALTFASDMATMVSGVSANSRWNQPITRGLKGIV